jgi:DNA polymerase III subunit epsilon
LNLAAVYAIVDIETTGTHASGNGITEIAIILHNGNEVEGRFQTLINPQAPIPKYVSSLTGIYNHMVADAPLFAEVAANIHSLLKGRIFVAHNVNFDYTFLRSQLKEVGYDWQARKLCTIRMTKKAFPGLKRYGLGHLCDHFGINNEQRHRATGDALATTTLFEMVLAKGGEQMIKDFLKKESREQILPPNLPEQQMKSLPFEPGVYYFHDAKGKVIYVGKAKCLKQRVTSHFTGLDTGKKRQEFLKNIHSISYNICPTEFTACILESVEIKRLWPAYNYSQKRFEQLWGIYLFEDARGYLRLAVDKKRKYLEPIASFGLMADAHRTLWQLVRKFELHAGLCFLDKTQNNDLPEILSYNTAVNKALAWLQLQKESFAIKEKESCVLVQDGKFYGMGIIKEESISDIDTLKEKLTPYPENEVIKSMIRQYAERYPARVLKFE